MSNLRTEMNLFILTASEFSVYQEWGGRWMDGRMDGWVDGEMDRRVMEGWSDSWVHR